MYGHRELVELGERVAEDGPRRHERALRELAFLVEGTSPGAAAVLRDASAPSVLRERAFSVAADVAGRLAPWSEEWPELDRTGAELQRLLLDWQGQLVGWGA